MTTNKQKIGRGIAIASVVWWILYLWLFRFDWIVTGICGIALFIGIITGWIE